MSLFLSNIEIEFLTIKTTALSIPQRNLVFVRIHDKLREYFYNNPLELKDLMSRIR